MWAGLCRIWEELYITFGTGSEKRGRVLEERDSEADGWGSTKWGGVPNSRGRGLCKTRRASVLCQMGGALQNVGGALQSRGAGQRKRILYGPGRAPQHSEQMCFNGSIKLKVCTLCV